MSLYQDYSYRADFRTFRKMLLSTISSYVENSGEIAGHFLLVSKYMKLSIVDCRNTESVIDGELYPLSEFFVDGFINEDFVDKIVYQCIIVPSQLPETKLEVLIDCMKRDFQKGVFPEVFSPYFKWKFGKSFVEQITLFQIQSMKEKINEMLDDFEDKHPDAYDIHDDFIVNDPWQATRGFKEDKCMVAYLQYIDDQLSDLQMLAV